MIAKLRDSGEWPRLKRWTREEYHQLAETGLLQDVRVQLIGGEIVEMTPQGNRHCVAVGLIEEALRTAFGANHWVRVQMPLALLDDSEPEPDLAVVFGSPREWAEQPRGALVVVEVSDATLTFDVRRKASLYASGGIDDYWVLDLGERQLLVHRGPNIDADTPFGWRYTDVKTLTAHEAVAPLAKPGSAIRVADLLP